MQVINNTFKEGGTQSFAQNLGQVVGKPINTMNSTNNKILNTEEIKEIQQYMNTIENHLKKYYDDIHSIIKYLNDEEIVQSFFNSGLLGKNVKEKIEQLDEILTNYVSLLLYDGVAGSLMFETHNFLRNQENYVNIKIQN